MLQLLVQQVMFMCSKALKGSMHTAAAVKVRLNHHSKWFNLAHDHGRMPDLQSWRCEIQEDAAPVSQDQPRTCGLDAGVHGSTAGRELLAPSAAACTPLCLPTQVRAVSTAAGLRYQISLRPSP